ncbi:DpnI domain-containing protein [Calditerrivibrio sp.]|uniref:DpnI domain-containing protein n=1 Tax=Calditerrivibrio sp. TaxID=2792612 RepID=UPI003D095FC2
MLKFENNRPLSDYFCDNCKEEFELERKKSADIGKKIVMEPTYLRKLFLYIPLVFFEKS